MSRKGDRTRSVDPPRRRRAIAAPLALAGVFALKAAVLAGLQGHPLLQPDSGIDTVVYMRLAGDVSTGNTAAGPGLYFVAPLYIYFLAATVNLLGGAVAWVRVLQILLGTVAVALIFKTADLWYGRVAAWWAAALAAFTGLFTFHEALLLPAALDPFLTAFALYAAARALDIGPGGRRPVLLAAAAGAAFGVAALNRPTMLMAAAGVAAVAATVGRWRTSAAMAAGAVLVLAPLLVRNVVVSGDWTPLSSHGGVDFYVGNNQESDGTQRIPPALTPSVRPEDEARRVAEAAVGRRLSDGEVSAYFYGQGAGWIASNPGGAARLFARKAALAMNAGHPSPNYSYTYYARDERGVLRLLAVGPWLLVPLGLAGLVLGLPADPVRRRALLAWSAFVPFYAAGLVLFFVSSRHRLPLLVPLAIGSGGAIAMLTARLAAKRTVPVPPESGTAAALDLPRGRPIAAAATFVLAALLAHWPVQADDGRIEERTRMALWLIGQERYGEAEARLVDLSRAHGERALLHFRAGRAYLAKGQADSAIRHLEQSRAADPNRPEADYALGQALLDARRPKEAIPHLRRAQQSGLRPDLVGFDLARALGASGDRAGAIRVLQTIRPAQRNDADSWGRLGELALNLEAPRLSEAFYRQALEARPDDAKTYEQMGLAIALSGRYEEAIAALERSVRLDPSNASAQLNLAVAYAEVGRPADARARAEESLRLNPGYDKARQFLKAIEGK